MDSDELSKDARIHALTRQLERMQLQADLREAAVNRAAAYRTDAVEKLLHENSKLRSVVDGDVSASKNAALIRRTIAESTDTSLTSQCCDLQNQVEQLKVEKNRQLAELNRRKATHEHHVAELTKTHVTEVGTLQSKLHHVNEVLHKLGGRRVLGDLASYKIELFELKEALFVIKEELHKGKQIFQFGGAFQAIQTLLDAQRRDIDTLTQERNVALQFCNDLRRGISDAWCGVPLVDDLRKNLGRQAETSPIVAAVRDLTQRYVASVSTVPKSGPSGETVATQCDLTPPPRLEIRTVIVEKPAPAVRTSSFTGQTPAEWNVAVAPTKLSMQPASVTKLVVRRPKPPTSGSTTPRGWQSPSPSKHDIPLPEPEQPTGPVPVREPTPALVVSTAASTRESAALVDLADSGWLDVADRFASLSLAKRGMRRWLHRTAGDK
jgi:cell division protein FtsB